MRFRDSGLAPVSFGPSLSGKVSQMLPRVVTIALVSLLSIVLLVSTWPQLLDLQAAPVIAQVVSLRGSTSRSRWLRFSSWECLR
jgi:hypothetical protein